ncbi:hypothetical protein [Vibrio paracholerae]|uniref:hypothetical protein n=1 Tax=Vibrio paracholerae TaxID=650003 RepID=UPI0012679A82|nr:hypothetical protein [Vibrio paracholerae]
MPRKVGSGANPVTPRSSVVREAETKNVKKSLLKNFCMRAIKNQIPKDIRRNLSKLTLPDFRILKDT